MCSIHQLHFHLENALEDSFQHIFKTPVVTLLGVQFEELPPIRIYVK